MKLISRKKISIIVILFLTILVAFILSMSVYRQYFNSGYDNFYQGEILQKSGVNITKPKFESKKNKNDLTILFHKIDKEEVSLFYAGIDDIGIGVYDASNYLGETLNITTEQFRGQVVVVREDSFLAKYIVQDGILNISGKSYQVLAYFDDEQIPNLFNRFDYFYPLQSDEELAGEIIFYSKFTEGVEKVITAMRNENYTIMTELISPNLVDVLIDFVAYNITARAMVITFTGIICNFILLLIFYYKKISCIMLYHHLYGARKKVIYIKTALQWIVLSAISVIISMLITLVLYNDVKFQAYLLIASLVFITSAIFMICIHSILFHNWNKSMKKMGIL